MSMVGLLLFFCGNTCHESWWNISIFYDCYPASCYCYPSHTSQESSVDTLMGTDDNEKSLYDLSKNGVCVWVFVWLF